MSKQKKKIIITTPRRRGNFGSHVKTCNKQTKDSKTEHGRSASQPFDEWFGLTQKTKGRQETLVKTPVASAVLFVVNNITNQNKIKRKTKSQ